MGEPENGMNASQDEPQESSNSMSFSNQTLQQVVAALSLALDLRTDKQPLSAVSIPSEYDDPLEPVYIYSQLAGVVLREIDPPSAKMALSMVQQGLPLVVAEDEGTLHVVESSEASNFEVKTFGTATNAQTMSPSAFAKLISNKDRLRVLTAEKSLQCETMSALDGSGSTKPASKRPGPFTRWLSLVKMDRRDIGLVFLFAAVAGFLGLATPLFVETLVNVVGWGIYLQPLIVLAFLLLMCLGIAAILAVLQTWIVEIIQRRQFVRIMCDLSHRFPRANQKALEGKYPREFSNRMFDVMTIQKATAILLLDGVSISLTTTLGLVLLAFYHPLLCVFGLMLVSTMISGTWLLGRGGIGSAIKESGAKYAVIHWLQDVIAMPTVFKTGGAEQFAVRRANQLTTEYINARKRKFAVVIRQVIFALSLQAIASTALLGLGGWLVIEGELTLGQLVASELVVTVVVGSFAKAGKALEKFYELMAGIDKVGYLVDIPPDPLVDAVLQLENELPVRWSDLSFKAGTITAKVPAAEIEPGDRAAVIGDGNEAKTLLAQSIAGLVIPQTGTVQVEQQDAVRAAMAISGGIVGYAGRPQIFHGTVRENIDIGRDRVSTLNVQQAAEMAGLDRTILRLEGGIEARLQTGGAPLSAQQCSMLSIARAIACHPSVLVIDGLLDDLSPSTRNKILSSITDPEQKWTLIVITSLNEVADQLNSNITIRA